jgi:hypothetical protein
LPAGLYLLDPKHAAEQLAAGRCAGICKTCGLEFRTPANSEEWPSFIERFIRHPLEHDNSEDTRQFVEETLAKLRDGSRAEAEAELARIFVSHLDELIASGALVRVGRDS